MKVPIFRLNYDSEYRKEFYRLCDDIFDRAFLTNDRMVEKFEERFARFTGATGAVATSNGSSALDILFLALGVDGGEVILSTNTFIATAQAAVRAGAIPVLCDIEPEYLGIDPKMVERLITPKTKAVCTTHIGGIISPSILRLRELCAARGIVLLEDCAHAHGCSLEGTPAGGFGLGGMFSFFVTKSMTTGEGGMIVSNSDDILERARSLRQFGRISPDRPHEFERMGTNGKMTEFQAALGLVELDAAARKFERRRKIASIYQERLRETRLSPMSGAPNSVCTYYKQILWPRAPRAPLVSLLHERGIAVTNGVFNTPLHRQPVMAGTANDRDFPVANHFSEHHVCPPCYADLTEEEAHYVCDVLSEYDVNAPAFGPEPDFAEPAIPNT